MTYRSIFDRVKAIEAGDADTLARESEMLSLHSSLECAMDSLTKGETMSVKHHVLSALGHVHALMGLGVIHVQQQKD